MHAFDQHVGGERKRHSTDIHQRAIVADALAFWHRAGEIAGDQAEFVEGHGARVTST